MCRQKNIEESDRLTDGGDVRLGIITHNVVRGDGQGRVNYEIAKFARMKGAEVTLIANRVGPELLDLGIVWKCIPTLEIANLLKGVEFAIRASWLMSRENLELDVVMCNGFVYLLRHDVNAVHFVHGAWLRSKFYTYRAMNSFYSIYQKTFTALNSRWEKLVFDRSKCLVAVSEKIAAELDAIGQDREKIKVITNGVDTVEFSPGYARREPLGLPSGVVLALFIGDIRTRRKNLDSVLLALQRCLDLHLAVVGNTKDSPFPALAESLGVSERVHFLGFRNDVPEIMRASDFFVFPSRYEAAPLVLLEALSSGLPVISARSAAAEGLVGDDAGYLLDDPEDVGTLARRLTTLSADPQLRGRLAEGARGVALKHTWERMACSYWDLFVSIGEAKAAGIGEAVAMEAE